MSREQPEYIRWTRDEWRKVAVHALPHLDKGVPADKALMRAQRAALPKDRRHSDESLRMMQRRASTTRFLDEARALPPETRDEIAPPPPPRKAPAPRKKLDEGRDYGDPAHPVKWTTREKALIARQVDTWRKAGDKRKLSRLVIEAQEVVLPRDRRRSIVGIQVATAKGIMARLIDEGRQNQWLLDQHPAEAAPEAEQQQPAEPQHVEPTNRPVEAANEDAAPIPPTESQRALSEAARAFGDTVMQALDTLLAVHTETVMREVYAKMSAAMSAQAAATSEQIATQIAAMIERGMRETVHKIVEAELGPVASPTEPGSASTPHEPPAQPAASTAEARPSRLRVDVVGLTNGSMEQQVRQAINGHADLRFFDPDIKGGYVPHRGRHCIMVTQRVPHSLKHKIKAAGVQPIYVKSTTGHVIHAIEELHRAQEVAS